MNKKPLLITGAKNQNSMDKITSISARAYTLKEVIEFLDQKMKEQEITDYDIEDAYCDECNAMTELVQDCKTRECGCNCHLHLENPDRYIALQEVREHFAGILENTYVL